MNVLHLGGAVRWLNVMEHSIAVDQVKVTARLVVAIEKERCMFWVKFLGDLN